MSGRFPNYIQTINDNLSGGVMASSLISNTNSLSQYQANLLTNTPGLIRVLVEDEQDVVVWHRILSKLVPDKRFDIHPYSFDSSINGKGKAQIMAQSGQFGPYYIGCVDSDTDWTLQQWSADAAIINSSPYILQTYAYSIENLSAQPYNCADFMLECNMHSCTELLNLDRDYSAFIKKLSIYSYESLIWYLTLIKERNATVDWTFLYGNRHYAGIRNDNALSLEDRRTAILDKLNERALILTAQYSQNYPELVAAKESLKTTLRNSIGLTADNAYLYVRGHNLYDFLIHNFFEPVQSYLRIEHESEIRAHTIGSDTGNAIRHYHKVIKDFGSHHIFRTDFMNDEGNLITQRLKQDINAVFR